MILSLEARTVGFGLPAPFAQWRAIIGFIYQQPRHVEHFDVLSAT